MIETKGNKKCVWHELVDDTNDDILWETGCGKLHYFEFGVPLSLHVKYCPYCGNEIEEREGEGEYCASKNSKGGPDVMEYCSSCGKPIKEL